MLMVVFGAGASYDSAPTYPPSDYMYRLFQERLPLARELFDANRPLFAETMDLFPQCKPIIPSLQRPPSNSSVEQELQRLQAHASGYPERHRQLAAIRFYLRIMLWRCEMRWKAKVTGITNYKALMDEIEQWRESTSNDEKICLVTFNYDTMLEDALPTVGVKIDSLSDYTATNYKIIKLHGSINWVHEVEEPSVSSDLNDLDVAHALIAAAPNLKFAEGLRIVEGTHIGRIDSSIIFPAIAIPVENKSEYECPEDHVGVLRECLEKVTKVLVVGWRAAENDFLGLMKERLGHRSDFMIVAGSEEGAREVGQRLVSTGIKMGSLEYASHGFTEHIVSHGLEKLLTA